MSIFLNFLRKFSPKNDLFRKLEESVTANTESNVKLQRVCDEVVQSAEETIVMSKMAEKEAKKHIVRTRRIKHA